MASRRTPGGTVNSLTCESGFDRECKDGLSGAEFLSKAINTKTCRGSSDWQFLGRRRPGGLSASGVCRDHDFLLIRPDNK